MYEDRGVREEVLNVRLSDILRRKGLLASPERIRSMRSPSRESRRLPDVTVSYLLGVRVVIEGRTEGPAGVQSGLTRDSKKRIEDGLCSICIAVVYPRSVKEAPESEIEAAMLAAKFPIRMLTEDSDGEWFMGDVSTLAESLRRTYDTLTKESVVDEAVSRLRATVENAAQAFREDPNAPDRFRKVIGIR